MAGKKRKRKPPLAVDVSKVAGGNDVIAGLLTMFLGESDVESFDDAAYRLNLKEGIERMVGKTHAGDIKTRTWFDLLMQRATDHYEEQQTLRMHNAWVGSNIGNYMLTRMLTHSEQATDKLLNLSEESALFAKGGGLDKTLEATAKRSADIVLAALTEMGKTAKAAVETE